MRSETTREETVILGKIDRRNFLKITGFSTGGIILGMQFACSPSGGSANAKPFSPNVYLTINPDGSVVIVAHRSEMGTGIRTSLPLVVADELEASWQRVTIVQAEGDESKYGNQNTDGSFSVRMFFTPMRKAGAAARMMLEQAAANRWKVPVDECRAANHEVVHTSGKKLGYGELAGDASALQLPADDAIRLKSKAEWKFINHFNNAYDTKDIVSGKARFGMDVTPEGAKYAVILRCPVAGGKFMSYNAEKARAVAGVLGIYEVAHTGFPAPFETPLGGIAVVADNTWTAISARDLIEVQWDNGPNADYDTDKYLGELLTKVKKEGKVRRSNGSIREAFARAEKVLESTYVIPHLSHAPMEPPNAVALVKDGKCEVWAPVQSPQWVRDSLVKALDMDAANVTVNVTLLGGAFGRKSKPDFVVEAALLSKQSGYPIKLQWTREDDIRHDFFHACAVQHVRVAFDKQKKVIAWNHRSAFPPIGGTTNTNELEPSAGELQLGMVDFPYDIPNISCESHEAPARTRIGWLRSVSNIQHAFAVGSMLDEIAAFRKMDPVDNLLDLLGADRDIPFKEMMPEFENYGEPLDQFPWNTARFRNVIKLVAEKSGWGQRLPKGQGMGICAHKSFLTYVACVVKVSVEGGKIRIPEVHYAVDCGVVVNRNSVINQFEGGAVFALSGALKGSIDFKNGQTVQTNFDKYGVMHMEDAPGEVFVHLVDSDEKPTGVGEPPVPPVAPALANALFAATGKRYRNLPVRLN
jgi:isoquinoline 1-oxidoreductase beta subunit